MLPSFQMNIKGRPLPHNTIRCQRGSWCSVKNMAVHQPSLWLRLYFPALPFSNGINLHFHRFWLADCKTLGIFNASNDKKNRRIPGLCRSIDYLHRRWKIADNFHFNLTWIFQGFSNFFQVNRRIRHTFCCETLISTEHIFTVMLWKCEQVCVLSEQVRFKPSRPQTI